MPYDINETHDPNLKSWVESANAPGTEFPIQNLPFVQFESLETFLADDGETRVPEHYSAGVRIGDHLLDLQRCVEEGLFKDELFDALGTPFLDSMESILDADAEAWSMLRAGIVNILRKDGAVFRGNAGAKSKIILPIADCRLLPIFKKIPNYTDFYASIHHASTVGAMFRPDNALLPNYKWVPIGYHGRASSIVPSGSTITRPRGQTKADDAPAPTFGPSKLLDYELEVGFFVGRGNELGTPIHIGEAEDHILGLCLVNDWSARDFQKWEYQPLGPFLAKNFATSVSPYLVTMEALAPFRVPAYPRPAGDPAPLPHLYSERDQKLGGIDITLEVFLASKEMRERGIAPIRLSRGSFKDMYWTIAQLLTHHASNGCNMQPGDLLASGTISGPTPDSRGCLLELTWDGPGKPRKPIELPTGEKRTFLEDGDEVIMRGYCEREGFRRIGFGECRGIIAPSRA
ncbi:MAG: fumarylacetoacetase [Phycisphaerae bacterium]|nr:fumarylacetoacetase [Phycisphaerae bacterium]